MTNPDRQAVNKTDTMTLTFHDSAAQSVLLLMAKHLSRPMEVPCSPCCCCVRAVHLRAWYGDDSDAN